MDNHEFSKQDVERSFRKFNDLLQDMMQANQATWETCLDHLVHHCEKNAVMQVITEPLRLSSKIDIDAWINKVFEDRYIHFPIDDEDQVALIYKLFLKIEEKQLRVWDIGISAFGSGNLDVLVSEFNTQFVSRFNREVSYRLDDILAKLSGKPEVPREALLVFQEAHPMAEKDNPNVFVVHGRNEKARSALFSFLRSIGLHPMEWSELITQTGKGSPYIGEILDAAFSKAQAVVVLITPDDEARLQEHFHQQNEPAHETDLTPQARPNVIFEAGMALGRNPDRTILVEMGESRPFSDVAGRHVIRLDDSTKKRQALAQRLETAGCPVNLKGTDWHTDGNFDLSMAVTQPQSPTLRVEGIQPQQAKPPSLVTDIVAVNTMKNASQILELTYTAAGGGDAGRAAAQAYAATLVDVILIRPGITDSALIDTVHSTAPIDYNTGIIG